MAVRQILFGLRGRWLQQKWIPWPALAGTKFGFDNRANCCLASRLFGLSANTRRKQYSRCSGAETQNPNPSHPCSEDGSISTTCANSAVACTKLPDFAAAIPAFRISSFDKISSIYLQSSKDTDILIPKCSPDLEVSGFEMMYQYFVARPCSQPFRGDDDYTCTLRRIKRARPPRPFDAN